MRIHRTLLLAASVSSFLLACASPDANAMRADAASGVESGTGGRSTGNAGAGANSAGRSGADAGSAGNSGASAGSAGKSGAGASAGSAGQSDASAAGQSGSSSDAGVNDDAGQATCNPSCPDGQSCELVQVMCVRAPCPPVSMCVAPKSTSCDPAKILCKRAVPVCPEGQVPSVDGSCYGPCVPVESCACTQETECPMHESYTCHKSAAHCGPYVE